MLTVACVYKKDPDPRFWASDVVALREGVAAHLTMRHRFLCLTDDEIGVMSFGIEVRHLLHDLRGWWSKMELFALSGPILYLDLDTIVIGSLDKLARSVIDASAVMVLRDFYSGLPASGVMGWGASCDLSWVLPEFLGDADRREYLGTNGSGLRCRTGQYIGDQNWLRRAFGEHSVPLVYAQDVAPGIYSYKVNIRGNGGPLEDASLICFHGRPRINEVAEQEPWLNDRVGLHSMEVRVR